jgi:hypothetical protein
MMPTRVWRFVPLIRLSLFDFERYMGAKFQEAEVEKIAPDRRVWVLMDIMGGKTWVAVGVDQLRAV